MLCPSLSVIVVMYDFAALVKLQNVVAMEDCDVDVNRPAVCDN